MRTFKQFLAEEKIQSKDFGSLFSALRNNTILKIWITDNYTDTLSLGIKYYTYWKYLNGATVRLEGTSPSGDILAKLINPEEVPVWTGYRDSKPVKKTDIVKFWDHYDDDPIKSIEILHLDKDAVIKTMLSMIREGDEEKVHHALIDLGKIYSWPEFKTIQKSFGVTSSSNVEPPTSTIPIKKGSTAGDIFGYFDELPPKVAALFKGKPKLLGTGSNRGEEAGAEYNKVLAKLGFTEMEINQNGKPIPAWGPKLFLKMKWERVDKDIHGTYYKLKNPPEGQMVVVKSISIARESRCRDLWIGKAK